MNDAYAAGILDGEGCLTVGLTKRVMTYDSRVYVGMTERAKGVLELFRREFGGTLRKSRGATEKWEAAWMWSVSGRGAAAVLARVLPHLVLKQRQGQLLAELEAMKADATGWTEDMRARAAAIRATVMDLNRKGPPPSATEPPVPGASFVRDVDGFLMERRNPDLFNEAQWQTWSGRFAGSGITGDGGFWTLDTSECPSPGNGYSACSLAAVLEPASPDRYLLSPRACAGILRRAARRGRALPPLLEAVLWKQAGLPPPSSEGAAPPSGMSPPASTRRAGRGGRTSTRKT